MTPAEIRWHFESAMVVLADINALWQYLGIPQIEKTLALGLLLAESAERVALRRFIRHPGIPTLRTLERSRRIAAALTAPARALHHATRHPTCRCRPIP